MTQQKIYFEQSPENIKDSFVKHVCNAISKKYPSLSNLNLDDLHIELESDKRILQKGTDQATIFHKAIYSSFDEKDYFSSDFWISYREHCLSSVNILKKETGYNGKWSIQRFPTIRFQFPENLSVFEFHRDSNYSHPIGEINCFYALNECLDSSALQIEKNLGFEDYVPLNLKPGEFALLNTSIFKHGDILNKTNKTRVSMDFRFIPSFLLNDDKSSLTKGIRFSSDSYFIEEKEMEALT